jgi:hypothetical protein
VHGSFTLYKPSLTSSAVSTYHHCTRQQLRCHPRNGFPCVSFATAYPCACSQLFRTVRNVYILIDYGDFVDGTSVTANPYIQLLATTEPTEAHQDFVNVRLGGKDDQSWQLLPASSTGSTPKANSQFVRKIEYYWPIIAAVAGFLILVLIISCLCVRRRKRTNSRPFWKSQKSYRPLQDPAPVGMHALGGPRPSTSDHRNPWDSRY